MQQYLYGPASVAWHGICRWARALLWLWLSGDTGYSPVHAEIGRRMPPPDLSAIPIGAYDPRFIMTDQHCDPEEALQIHKVLLTAFISALLAPTWFSQAIMSIPPPARPGLGLWAVHLSLYSEDIAVMAHSLLIPGLQAPFPVLQ